MSAILGAILVQHFSAGRRPARQSRIGSPSPTALRGFTSNAFDPWQRDAGEMRSNPVVSARRFAQCGANEGDMDPVGLINIGIGVLTLLSGVSGRYGLPGPTFVLPFTHSNVGLFVAGALIIMHGSVQIYRRRPRA